MNLKTAQRIQRAKEEKMYLLSVDADLMEFVVEGSKGIEYNINFKGSGVKCDCPYFVYNNKICKHIYFIINRVCKLETIHTDSKDINVLEVYPDIKIILQNLKNSKSIKNEGNKNTCEDDCCICYDTMKDSSVISCSECKQFIHESCMKIWSRSKKTCPLCRSLFNSLDSIDSILDPLIKLKISK